MNSENVGETKLGDWDDRYFTDADGNKLNV